MVEPQFIAKVREPDSNKRWEWMSTTSRDAANKTGCVFFRVSFDAKTSTCLLEGWLEKPEDCGNPRWGYLT